MQQQQFPKEGCDGCVQFIYTFTQTHPVKLLLYCLYWLLYWLYIWRDFTWECQSNCTNPSSGKSFIQTTYLNQQQNILTQLRNLQGVVVQYSLAFTNTCFSLSNLNFWLRWRLQQNLFLAESLVIPKCSQTFPSNWISQWELENKIQMRENRGIKFACRANKHFDK